MGQIAVSRRDFEQALRLAKMNIKAKAVAFLYASYSYNGKEIEEVWPSADEIAEVYCINRKTAQGYRKALIDAGWLFESENKLKSGANKLWLSVGELEPEGLLGVGAKTNYRPSNLKQYADQGPNFGLSFKKTSDQNSVPTKDQNSVDLGPEFGTDVVRDLVSNKECNKEVEEIKEERTTASSVAKAPSLAKPSSIKNHKEDVPLVEIVEPSLVPSEDPSLVKNERRKNSRKPKTEWQKLQDKKSRFQELEQRFRESAARTKAQVEAEEAKKAGKTEPVPQRLSWTDKEVEAAKQYMLGWDDELSEYQQKALEKLIKEGKPKFNSDVIKYIEKYEQEMAA